MLHNFPSPWADDIVLYISSLRARFVFNECSPVHSFVLLSPVLVFPLAVNLTDPCIKHLSCSTSRVAHWVIFTYTERPCCGCGLEKPIVAGVFRNGRAFDASTYSSEKHKEHGCRQSIRRNTDPGSSPSGIALRTHNQGESAAYFLPSPAFKILNAGPLERRLETVSWQHSRWNTPPIRKISINVFSLLFCCWIARETCTSPLPKCVPRQRRMQCYESQSSCLAILVQSARRAISAREWLRVRGKGDAWCYNFTNPPGERKLRMSNFCGSERFNTFWGTSLHRRRCTSGVRVFLLASREYIDSF